MKKTLVIGLAIGMALTATSAMATIVGSDHDMNTNASYGTDAQQRICVYCHHPHNSVKANATGTGVNDLHYSPLWNREYRADRNGDGTSDFIAYNNGVNMSNTTTKLSSTSKHLMNGKPAIGGVSLLCLSCHDGVTAVSAYSSNNPAGPTGSVLPFGTPANPTNVITGPAALGTDLSNHHPIGMSWDEVTAGDDEIAQKTDTFKDTTITIGSVLTGGDTMECSSCHDVHNTNVAGRNNAERFLWTSNNSSHFCLSCHLK